MIKTLCAILFVLLFILPVSAIEISGKAVGFEGRFIRLYLVSDFISEREVKSDVYKILEDGSFTLNVLSTKPCMVKLKIDDKIAQIIVLPKTKIQLKLEYDPAINQGKIFDKELTIEILNNSDRGVNELIWAYQKELAAFLEKNHTKLVTKHILPEVLKFQIAMRAMLTAEELPYFRTYLIYSLGILEDAVLGSEKKLFEQYIAGKRIAYNNLGYMNFFVQFYQDRFMQIAQGSEGFQFLSAVNGTQDYDKVMEIVTKQPFISNDTLAQLFIILGVQEVYGDEQFEDDKLLSLLDTLESKSLNNYNRNIAVNIQEQLTFLNLGKEAPDFSLFDEKGKVHHLTDFIGKNVLLFFWSAQSPYSLKELIFMDEYSTKFRPGLQVIGVNIDDDRTAAKKQLIAKEHPWMKLFKDGQYDVIDKYRIHSAPVYVLIDKEGKILDYPAKKPEENLEEELLKLTTEDR